MKKPNPQNVISWVLGVIVAFILIAFSVVMAIVFAPVDLTLDEDSYTLSFFIFHKESADYSDLEEVALLGSDYESKRIHSFGGISKAFGTYENEDYGRHFRLTFAENNYNYILLKRKDGSVTVFNQKTASGTAALYESLLKKLP